MILFYSKNHRMSERNTLLPDVGYLICLSNPIMPGLLLVSHSLNAPNEKAAEFFSAGVPMPFQIEIAKKVKLPQEKEKSIHKLLDKYSERLHTSRHFFRVEKERVSDFFELLDGDYWLGEAPGASVILDTVDVADAWQTLQNKVYMLLKQDNPKENAMKLGQTKMKVANFIKAKYGVGFVPSLEHVREALADTAVQPNLVPV